MAVVDRITGDLAVTGNIQYGGSLIPGPTRTQLSQDDLKPYPVPFEDFRVWDAIQTNLPGTAAADDLGLYGGTFGTGQPLIRTEDVKTLSKSEYARTQIRLPAEYVAGETVQLRLVAGMVTTIAGTSCVVDVEAYRVGKDNTISADLCATAAQTCNSLTFANKDFTITSATLAAGDVLDVRITITVVDAATGTAVIGAIGGVDLLCDVKG
jgi:hypothetical protein